MSHNATSPSADRLTGLIAQSARGDEQAFAQFYEVTAARAYGVALRVLNPALAEEATQEAYLDAWRMFHRYDESMGSVVGWLLTLVHRRAVDRVRASEASARRDEAYQRRELPTVEVDTTAGVALASLDARQIRSAPAGLAPAQRHAINLAYFEGLSYAEVAAVVGAPLGTVKFWIRSGLRKLRSALEAVGYQAA